jgi:type I restriction enzyme S subunit
MDILMAKISYSDHVKKNDISVILSEIVFQYLKKQYKTIALSKVVNTSSGGTPSRTNPQYYGGQIPWLKSGELNDSIITFAEEFITEKGLNNSSAKIFPKGTLLVAMYGATAGKTGILNMDAASNQAVCSITPKDSSINTDFLFWFFRAHRFYFIDISRGGAQPNISQDVINKTLFPIVPKDIQEQIAIFLSNAEKTKFIDYSLIPNELHHDIKSAFNYLFCLESLVTENKAQQNYLTKLRQAILQEAIEGKLTADWRVNNPVCLGNPEYDAAALLETIKTEKQKLIAEGKIKKEKPLAPINPDDMLFTLPDGWVWVRLGEITLYSEAGKSFLCEEREVKDDEWGVVKVSSVSWGYFKERENKFYSKLPPNDLKYQIMVGDFIITRASGSPTLLGKSIIVPHIKKNLLLNDKTIRFVFTKHGIKMFVNLFNGSTYAKSHFMNCATGTNTSMRNLTRSDMEALLIPLPPLAEQNAIIERVDRLLATVNALEQQVQARKTHAEQLMQVVLKEAFAG